MIEVWKNKAHTKNIIRRDVVAYCIMRSIRADIDTSILLHKAFTPGRINQHRPTPYHAIKLAAEELQRELRYRKTLLGSKELYEAHYNANFQDRLDALL